MRPYVTAHKKTSEPTAHHNAHAFAPICHKRGPAYLVALRQVARQANGNTSDVVIPNATIIWSDIGTGNMHAPLSMQPEPRSQATNAGAQMSQKVSQSGLRPANTLAR